MIRVRGFRHGDADALRALFRRAVLEGAAEYYDASQRAAWAGAADAPPVWAERLGAQITLVAEDRAGRCAGFMTLGRDGHLDLAFVAPEAMGAGVAAALHDRILAEAAALGLTRLTTEASHLARRFLLKSGWQETGSQDAVVNGTRLASFRMEKTLISPAD